MCFGSVRRRCILTNDGCFTVLMQDQSGFTIPPTSLQQLVTGASLGRTVDGIEVHIALFGRSLLNKQRPCIPLKSAATFQQCCVLILPTHQLCNPE